VKHIVSFFIAVIVTFSAGAKYDAFTAEAQNGLDYVAAKSKGAVPDGDLGRNVYIGKVQDDYDAFIPTANYVRVGAGMNLGFASSGFRINGEKTDYNFGIGENMAIGLNVTSVFRTEIGWGHSDMRFNDGTADLDVGHLKFYFDLARRYVVAGDVFYRRRIVPFIGFGGSAGWVDFGNAGSVSGRDSMAYGANAEFGLSFVFSETNAVDLSVGYEYLFGADAGWDDPSKSFGNTSVMVSWRSGF
jgi:hypothetical protein